jgi:3-phosphoshikimate 1-carboxyvinyltransferase
MSAVRVEAPASKSMTQRALVIAALADGPTVVRRPLDCDDSRYLVELLRGLGLRVDWRDQEIAVAPGPLTAPAEPVFCGNAGTAVRFGACLGLLATGELEIDGDSRMRQRPIGPLADALATLGVEVTWLGRPGCPPLRMARRREPAVEVAVDASVSSQYASGLLLVAPRLPRGLSLELGGDLVSAPYIAMTVAMMRAAGAQVHRDGERRFTVAAGAYRAGEVAVEADWSAAAFLIAAARVTGVEVTVAGLAPAQSSLQGDAAFAAMMRELDVPGDHRFDLRDTPDLLPPLVAACLFAGASSRIRGVEHARVKESDRLAVLARELKKLGAQISEHPDGLDIEPFDGKSRGEIELDPEGDHRMAMTFGVVGLRIPGVVVREPQCVSKSFPTFWNDLATIEAQRSQP